MKSQFVLNYLCSLYKSGVVFAIEIEGIFCDNFVIRNPLGKLSINLGNNEGHGWTTFKIKSRSGIASLDGIVCQKFTEQNINLLKIEPSVYYH